MLLSEIAIFFIKRENLCEFPRKCFKTTEKHRLDVCDSFCGEKQFWLILSLFTGLIKYNYLNKS